MTEITLFSQFDLPQSMQASLEKMNYVTPTPVQAQAIPSALEGRDVLGSAQTGTGKTAAFCIPLVARLLADPEAMALVLTPTRELAAQIVTVASQLLANNREIKTALLIGGEAYARQFDQLRKNPRLIIGTPGRINDHLRRDPNLLSKVTMVVLDEADRMLDMGFSVQIDEIFPQIPNERQTLMFSATFADGILKFARRYLSEPVRVSVNPQQVSAPKIWQETVDTNENNKYEHLMEQLDKRTGSIIVFVRTQHGTERLARKLDHDNHDVDMLHGGLRQRQRDRAIAGFRAGKTRIMIATDVAARGLDVPHIETVINYDLPQNPEDFIHRIGRTGRAGAEGVAVSFIMPSERGKWAAIDRVMNPGKKSAPRGDFKSDNFKRDDFKRGPKGKSFGKPSYGAPKDDFFGEQGDNATLSGKRKFADKADGFKPKRKFDDKVRDERASRRGAGRFEKAEGGAKRFNAQRPERGEGFKKADGFKKEGGWKKESFKKSEGFKSEGFKSEGFKKADGFKKSEGCKSADGFKKSDGFKKPEGGWKKDGFKKSEGYKSDGFKSEGFKKADGFKKSGSSFKRSENDGNRAERPDFRADDRGNRKERPAQDRDGNRKGGFGERGAKSFGDKPAFKGRTERSGKFNEERKSFGGDKKPGAKSGGFKSGGGFKAGGFKGGNAKPARFKDGEGRRAAR